MKRVPAFLLVPLCSTFLFTSLVSAQQGDFTYGFLAAPSLPAPDLGPTQSAFDANALNDVRDDGPDWPAGSLADDFGNPGAATQGAFYCTLQQNDPGVTLPAQGWQMSFRARGCDGEILSVTATQTDIASDTIEDGERGPGGSGGFDATELTTGPGNEGAVTAIVLHLKKGTTLDPTGSNTKPATGPELNPLTVCRFLVSAKNPAVETDSCSLNIEYFDGLEGSGQPVENKVTQDGQSVVPSFANQVIVKTALPPPGTPCDQLPGEHGLGFSARVIDSDTYYDFAGGLITGPDPDTPAAGGTYRVLSSEGAVPTVTLYECVTIGPDVPVAQQPQGWQLATELTGAMEITEVSLGGTAIYALGAGPQTEGGFDVTEVISPVKNAGRKGFVSGVVLHLTKGTRVNQLTSELPGTAAVIRIELSGEAPQGSQVETAQLQVSNGLIGSGQSVDNKLTVAGSSLVPCNIVPPATAEVTLSLESGVVEPQFIRGDTNDDGQNNIADAIWILNETFRMGPVTACQDAADANDDGDVDPIVDAAYIIAYQFESGPQLPAPFGACGEDPTADALDCPPGSMSQCP